MEVSVIDALNQSIITENEGNINAYEDLLKTNIEKVVDIPSFYDLPTENLLRIIKGSKTEDISILKKLVFNISKHKGEEAPLILNVIDVDASIKDYNIILSNLQSCPICKRIHDILEHDQNLPMCNYEGEIKNLRENISSLKSSVQLYKIEINNLKSKLEKEEKANESYRNRINELEKESAPETTAPESETQVNGLRKCPGCGCCIELSSASAHVYCGLCGTHFCYYCGAGPYSDAGPCYKHLSEEHGGCFVNPPDYRKYILHEQVSDKELDDFYKKYPQLKDIKI